MQYCFCSLEVTEEQFSKSCFLGCTYSVGAFSPSTENSLTSYTHFHFFCKSGSGLRHYTENWHDRPAILIHIAGVSKVFFFHNFYRSTADPSIGQELQKHFSTPYFIPASSSQPELAWIFMGAPGPGASIHVRRQRHTVLQYYQDRCMNLVSTVRHILVKAEIICLLSPATSRRTLTYPRPFLPLAFDCLQCAKARKA